MTDHATAAVPAADDQSGAPPHDDLDDVLAGLADAAPGWVAADLDERITLVEQLRASTHAVAEEWAAVAADAKGVPADSPLRGEDWLVGPMVTLRHLRLLQQTLERVRDDDLDPDVETREDGTVVARVFPTGTLDQLLFPRTTGEVWFAPDVDEQQAQRTAAAVHRGGEVPEPRVCLVLGAGNVSSIPLMDVLTKLFNELQVVVCKLSPVTDHLASVFERAFAPLVERGLVAFVRGGGEVGQRLATHELVDTLHVTGSAATFEAVAYGPGEAGRRARQAGQRRNERPFTAELGNVTPVIVVPGPWSAGDVEYQADAIASMLVHNAGFNCVAARVVVNHRTWARRRDLLDGVRASLARAEPRHPYYPGAHDRWSAMVEAHPQAELFGSEGPQDVPFTLIPDVDPDDADARAFTTEAFCGVVAETALDAPLSIPEYLARAVAFCNDHLWGTLSATILVHPRSLKDRAVGQALEQAITDLDYGTVAVNTWPGVAYGMVSTPWGAAPGATDDDIQSGRGWVHDTTMLSGVRKAVVRAPFKAPLKPVWFHTHATLDEVGPRVTALEATGDVTALPSLLWHAMRG